MPGPLADVNAPAAIDLRRPPRTRGSGLVTVRRAGPHTRLVDLYMDGSLKVLFPGRPAPALEAVTLNTSGGLTGGDRLSFAAHAGPGASLVLSTQAAERAYASADPDPARIETRLTADDGAVLHWLPQETILYDCCALDRRLRVDLAPDARFLGLETLIFGRRAMGERLTRAALHDRWDIRRDGRRLFADGLRLSGDVAARLASPFGARGAGAMATVVLAAPDAAARLRDVRAMLPSPSGAAVPSEGLLVVRLLAEDGHLLRASLVPLVERLTCAPVPKVWRL